MDGSTGRDTACCACDMRGMVLVVSPRQTLTTIPHNFTKSRHTNPHMCWSQEESEVRGTWSGCQVSWMAMWAAVYRQQVGACNPDTPGRTMASPPTFLFHCPKVTSCIFLFFEQVCPIPAQDGTRGKGKEKEEVLGQRAVAHMPLQAL